MSSPSRSALPRPAWWHRAWHRLAGSAGGSLAAVGLMLAPLPAAAQGVAPLSVAAPGFPTAFVLEQLAARAAFLAGKASGEGALAASKSARELQLMIANAKAALRDQAEERWDKLGADEQALLRRLDQVAQTPPDPRQGRGRLEDPVVLDVAAALARPPFTDTKPSIRRVEGASQIYRAQGAYRLTIQTNLPAAGATSYAVSVAGQPAPPQWLQVSPPGQPAGTLVLTVPARALNDSFADRTLVHVPVEVSAVFPATSWKFWRADTLAIGFPFSLELFPRKPFSGVLKETGTPTEVDASRTLLARGKPVPVPGCGSPGCVRDQNVCNEVPAGAKPLEPVNFTDSALGDGSGSGWTGAVQPLPNGFCVIYKQQAPALSRSVGFDIRYNPLQGESKATERKWKPLQPDKPGDEPAETDALGFGRAHAVMLSPAMQRWELQLKAFNGQVYTASSGTRPSSPLLKLTPAERSAEGTRLELLISPPW